MKEKITVKLEPIELFKIVKLLGEQPAHSSAQLYLKMRELWLSYKKYMSYSFEFCSKEATEDDVRNIASEIQKGLRENHDF